MATTFLTSITEEELKQYLKESLKEALKELLTEGGFPGNPKEDLLTIDQASEFTHIPVATLYDYTHKKKIPFNKIGKKLLFLKKELLEWILSHRMKTNSEIRSQSSSCLLPRRK